MSSQTAPVFTFLPDFDESPEDLAEAVRARLGDLEMKSDLYMADEADLRLLFGMAGEPGCMRTTARDAYLIARQLVIGWAPLREAPAAFALMRSDWMPDEAAEMPQKEAAAAGPEVPAAIVAAEQSELDALGRAMDALMADRMDVIARMRAKRTAWLEEHRAAS